MFFQFQILGCGSSPILVDSEQDCPSLTRSKLFLDFCFQRLDIFIFDKILISNVFKENSRNFKSVIKLLF